MKDEFATPPRVLFLGSHSPHALRIKSRVHEVGGYTHIVDCCTAALRALDESEFDLILMDGDPSAAEQLLPLVYAEPRKLAAAQMTLESPNHTSTSMAIFRARVPPRGSFCSSRQNVYL